MQTRKTRENALSALARERQRPAIATLSSRIDALFPGGRGIPSGAVTEVVGGAGAGKTQFCLQLCANVQIPQSHGGLGGSAVFIDTEGSFSAVRLEHICKGTSDSVNRTAKVPLDVPTMLVNVQTLRIYSHEELYNHIMEHLEDWVQEDPSIKLIVLDSIALPFRHTFTDHGLRLKTLTTLAQKLRQIAEIYDIAIVITNQMTTKIVNKGYDNESSLMVPALGESWSHSCSNRVVLLWHQKHRHAWLCKSPNAEDAIVPFSIFTRGIRDLDLTQL